MQIDSRSAPFFITNPGGNATVATALNPSPQAARPSGDGVFGMGASLSGPAVDGGMAPQGFLLVPFGVGSATQTFSMNVFGWRHTIGLNPLAPLWVPYLLAEFSCTLGATPGIINTDVGAGQLFCDTIALVLGNSNISNEVLSPAGTGMVAHIVLDGKGSQLIEVRFGTGSSATSCNCLATRI